jgi:hypothetical protein
LRPYLAEGRLEDDKVALQLKNIAEDKFSPQCCLVNRFAEKHYLQEKKAVQFHGKKFYRHAVLGNSGNNTDSTDIIFNKKTRLFQADCTQIADLLLKIALNIQSAQADIIDKALGLHCTEIEPSSPLEIDS